MTMQRKRGGSIRALTFSGEEEGKLVGELRTSTGARR